jgi:phosphoserine aminotransferase
MYNFYPGPSKIYPEVKNYALEAFDSGILEKNHRSTFFMHLLEDCIKLFKSHLNIPSNYKVFFVSSATEAWEICAQSIFGQAPVKFYYNGAFGKKWMEYSEKLHASIYVESFDLNQPFTDSYGFNGDVCLVSNETSNGSHVFPSVVNNFKSNNSLLFVDAVSSLGGVDYTIEDADVWISSSQKCFGLPSGLGILILSPKALAKAHEVNDSKFYNSLLFIKDNFDKFQTPYTPNILAIYLLKRLLENLTNVRFISQKISSRADMLYNFLDKQSYFKPLISNKKMRSDTVLTVACPDLPSLHSYLNSHNVTIGKGYGLWKDSTFRIANFPAIDDSEYEYLLDLLSSFAKK